ncbi:beta-1,3-glucanase family protein [Microdochium nivale]|nr:beta-1,3-glucanase family protein [Microdochium nivale]
MRAKTSLLPAAAAGLLLASCPALTSALAIGHRHHIQHRNVAPPPAAPVPASPANDNFRLNVINRLPAGKKLYVYITGYDQAKREGFIRPAAGPDAPAQWYIPDARGQTEPVPITEDMFRLMPASGGDGQQEAVPLSLRLPTTIESGRIYFSEAPLSFSTVATATRNTVVAPSISNDQDPAVNISWGFVELTYRDAQEVRDKGGNRLYANLSFVDWVGIVLGMSVKPRASTPGNAMIIPGLSGPGGKNPDKALQAICDELKQLGTKDKKDAWWGELCVTDAHGKALRILAPNIYNHPAHSRSPEFTQYWDAYVNQVWKRYEGGEPLTVDTQLQAVDGMEANATTAAGVRCECVTSIAAGNMQCKCPGGGGGGTAEQHFVFGKPTTGDIFSCNAGAFDAGRDSEQTYRQLRARLCAAFVRSTLMLEGASGSLTPNADVTADRYYTAQTTDYYSKIVHKYLAEGKGYTFSFDDVDPGQENAAGVIEMPDPGVMNIVVGGWVTGDENLGLGE